MSNKSSAKSRTKPSPKAYSNTIAAKQALAKKPDHKLRIIAGKWRGRRLAFAEATEIRPTADRVRETLFNWLAPVISGATCLDLFAGSGMLSFEALSRGAKQVVMIDHAAAVVRQLRQNIALLNADNAIVYQAKIPDHLPLLTPLFDIIFLDPPFRQGLIRTCCDYLAQQPFLAKPALLYIEAERELVTLPIPPTWQMLRSQQAGQVGYHLIKIPAE